MTDKKQFVHSIISSFVQCRWAGACNVFVKRVVVNPFFVLFFLCFVFPIIITIQTQYSNTMLWKYKKYMLLWNVKKNIRTQAILIWSFAEGSANFTRGQSIVRKWNYQISFLRTNRHGSWRLVHRCIRPFKIGHRHSP